MKVDFDVVVVGLDGIQLKAEGDKPLTVGSVCVSALTNPLTADQQLSGEDAFKRLELARRIYKGGEQEIDPAEAVLIRDRAAKMFTINVSGLVYEKLR